MVTRLVDTSVWVEYLRDTDARHSLRELLASSDPQIVTTEPVAMELLAGPTDPRVIARLTRLVDGLTSLSVDQRLDFRSAAAIARACRQAGDTVRSLPDCLIAAIAIRADVTLVHRDVDFERIAAVTPLRSEGWP